MCVGLEIARRQSAHDIKVPRERFESMRRHHCNIDQWEPSALCSSLGALMTSYMFKAGARKQNHDGGRG